MSGGGLTVPRNSYVYCVGVFLKHQDRPERICFVPVGCIILPWYPRINTMINAAMHGRSGGGWRHKKWLPRQSLGPTRTDEIATCARGAREDRQLGQAPQLRGLHPSKDRRHARGGAAGRLDPCVESDIGTPHIILRRAPAGHPSDAFKESMNRTCRPSPRYRPSCNLLLGWEKLIAPAPRHKRLLLRRPPR